MSKSCTKNYIDCIFEKWREKTPISKLVIQIIGLSIFNAVFLGIVYTQWYTGLSYVASLTAIITSAIVAICFVSYTYHRTNELRYTHALKDLACEMRENNNNLKDDEFDIQIQKIKNKIGKQWIGFDKKPSFTNWSNDPKNFYLKYLPTTNYYYFIQQGFFNETVSKKIQGGTKSSIAKIYGVYSQFNNIIQGFENNIDKTNNTCCIDDIRDKYHVFRDTACKLNFFENYDDFQILSDEVVEVLDSMLSKK